jgi:hypothetical protein
MSALGLASPGGISRDFDRIRKSAEVRAHAENGIIRSVDATRRSLRTALNKSEEIT